MSIDSTEPTAASAHTPGFYAAERERRAADQIIAIKRKLYAPCERVELPKAPEFPAAQPRRRKPADAFLRAEWGQVAPPPPARRGAESAEGDGLFKEQNVRVHWLSVTFPVAPAAERGRPVDGMPNVEIVRQLVSRRLGQAEDRLRGMYSYASGCQWDEKALLCWTDGRGEAFLDLNGDTMDQLFPDQQLQLMDELRELGAKATRVDVAFDDGHRIASMDDVHKAARAGNYAGFLKSTPLRSCHRDGTILEDTVYFGARGKDGSGKFMRIYDKFLESGGLVDAIRYEVEYRKEKADEAFQLLARCGDARTLASVIGKLVGGAITFLDRSHATDSHLERLPLLDWWVRIVSALGRTRITGRRIIAKLQGTLQAMKRQYGCSIALLKNVLDSMGVNLHAVVDSWCETYEQRINWDRQKRRDLSLSLPLLIGAA